MGAARWLYNTLYTRVFHATELAPLFLLSSSATLPTLESGGKVTVDPAQQKQWDRRLAELGERVRFFLDPSNPVPPPQSERPCYTEEFAYRDVAGNAAKKRSRDEC